MHLYSYLSIPERCIALEYIYTVTYQYLKDMWCLKAQLSTPNKYITLKKNNLYQISVKQANKSRSFDIKIKT